MAGIYRDDNAVGWYAQIWYRGFLRKVWLGKCTKAQAQVFSRHLETLKSSRDVGCIPPTETQRWLDKVHPRIRRKLAQWDLCDGQVETKFSAVLNKFCKEYIDSREDWTAGTRRNMGQVRAHLSEVLGTKKLISHVTQGDAERFARWCRSHFKAESHAESTLKKAKQFFNAAVKERLISESPFADVKVANVVSNDKKQEIPRETIDLLIKNAEPYLGAVIAFARYGGLRCPSEHLSIEWQKVDWDRNRFDVYSPKTKAWRTVPIFPELKPHFDWLWETAEPKAKYAFDRNRSAAARRYRKWMLDLIEKTPGVEPWPDLWRNLRFTRKNELLKQHKEHVVCAWIGHDRNTGRTYYDRATESDFNAAICGTSYGS